MRSDQRVCVKHPDRRARVDAAGILVCDNCFRRYESERRERQGPFIERRFYQSLVRLQHGL